jgi:hypothetical protein
MRMLPPDGSCNRRAFYRHGGVSRESADCPASRPAILLNSIFGKMASTSTLRMKTISTLCAVATRRGHTHAR